ncbi:cilia- and flagella-associated protein 251 isoform X1 [Lampetra fluviatilis]
MAESPEASKAVDHGVLGQTSSPEPPSASTGHERGEIDVLLPEPTTPLNDDEEEASVVSTATPRVALDTPSSTDHSSPEALVLAWSIGVNSRVAVRSLQDAERKAVIYTCGRAVVLFDYEKHTQHILQGHANTLSCMCLSENKRWLATADTGPGSTVIVWDTYSGIPVHTLFSCHPEEVVVAMTMSPDASYIITLGTKTPQRVSVWRWTIESDLPVCSVELDPDWGYQTHVTFNISDHRHFITNSETQAVFYQWSDNSIEMYTPVLNEQTFGRAVGPLTHSVFSQSSVLSGTATGNLVVWSVPGCAPNVHTATHGGVRKALKLLHLQDRPITTLALSDQFVVTGDTTGTVRYYDLQLRLLFWLQIPHVRVQQGSRSDKGQEAPGRLPGGTKTSGQGVAAGHSVVCVSFSAEPGRPQEGQPPPRDASLKAAPFVAREFVASMRDGSVFNIKPYLYPDLAASKPQSGLALGPWCTALPGALSGCVQALAAHPDRPLVCMATSRGTVILWDLDTQRDVASREFRTSVSSLAYDQPGKRVAIGFSDGCTRVVCGLTLADETVEPLDCQRPEHRGSHAVTRLCFSHDGRYLATSDTTHAVSVFVTVSASEWRLLGRQRAHSQAICDIVFETHPDKQQDTQQDMHSPRLLSLGEDRILVEYGLSSNEVSVLRFERVEQSAVPLCLLFHPALSAETFLLTANNQHKYKLYNATTLMCRKTTLAPLLGSPLKKICALPNTDKTNKAHFLVFITNDCVGLQMLPLDGNPHHWVGVHCHVMAVDSHMRGAVAGGGVQDVACSYDGRYVVTAGKADGAVHVWRVNTMAIHTASSLAGEGIVPFYSMLECGREGDFFRELEDYFYFAQLQRQGLETLDVREVCDRVDLAHVPSLMRALGHYPTQQEIEQIINEVRFAHYAETGEFVTSLNLPEFLRLYLNHRPVEGPTLQSIRDALTTLGGLQDGHLDRSQLLHALLNTGERMTEGELAECFSSLMSLKSPRQGDEAIESQEVLQMALPETVTPEGFTEQVLGFTSP